MNPLLTFFNSSFFIALVTGAAGGIAIFLYNRRQGDNKKDAANIVLLEIQNAERLALQARDSLITEPPILQHDIYLMPTENWSKYKYLFVRDFDRDQWDRITAFYVRCALYDESVSYSKSFFEKDEEQSRVSLHRMRESLVREYTELSSTGESLVKEREAITKKLKASQDNYLGLPSLLYNPMKPVTDAKRHIANLQMDLSQTSVGAKLKKMSKIRN